MTGLQRCGKSCRLRWMNYLRPDLKRGNFTEEEDELIIKLHSLLGNKLVSSLSLVLEKKKTRIMCGCFSFFLCDFYLKSDQNIHLQMVVDCWEISRKDRQRDQKLLEHSHQEEASQPRDWPKHAPSDQRIHNPSFENNNTVTSTRRVCTIRFSQTGSTTNG